MFNLGFVGNYETQFLVALKPAWAEMVDRSNFHHWLAGFSLVITDMVEHG